MILHCSLETNLSSLCYSVYMSVVLFRPCIIHAVYPHIPRLFEPLSSDQCFSQCNPKTNVAHRGTEERPKSPLS